MTTIPIENFGPAPAGWEECPICFDASEIAQDITGHQPEIGDRHGFHANCLAQWVRTGHDDCPMCRTSFEREVTQIDLRKLVLPSALLNLPVMLILDSVSMLRGIQQTAEEHHELSRTHIEFELVTATALSAYLFATGSFPLSLLDVEAGMVLGYGISAIVRMTNEEDLIMDQNVVAEGIIEAAFKSNSFKAAVGVVSGAALLAAGAPMVAAAIATSTGAILANYAVEQLHTRNFISREKKQSIQTSVTVAAAVASLMIPMRAVGVVALGSAMGAIARSKGTLSGGVRRLWNAVWG